ncbi:MAG TPA: sugar transferase [Sphingomicrobium sp.]|nr:sugar transferase [Sphingomicrobium sp.]
MMERVDALSRAETVVQQPSAIADGCASNDGAVFLLNGSAREAPRVTESPARQSHAFTNRCLDLVLASLLLVLMLPLMGLCALSVLLTSRGPLLFKQPRVGRDGRVFNCLKFRTMIVDADAAIQRILQSSKEAQEQWLAVQKLQDDPRITPVGRLLRRYCLDELPQLFNVLAGEMSIVGPRPIVGNEISRYGPRFLDYCSVKPGLTGLWQVSGRHSLSYDQRVRLDSEYARTKSVSTDLIILWRTVPLVLLGFNE